MPNWHHHINVSGWWRDTSISIEDKGKKLAKILQNSVLPHYPDDAELLDIISGFEAISSLELEGREVTEEFDACLSCLYDWADQGHRLWINTIK